MLLLHFYTFCYMLSHKTEDLAGKPTRNSAGETLGCQVFFLPFLLVFFFFKSDPHCVDRTNDVRTKAINDNNNYNNMDIDDV